MSCDTLTMFTPQKPLFLEADDIFLLDDIENKLESFSHLLERSSAKEKDYVKKFNEQSAVISSLKEESEGLADENRKLRLIIESHMKNFKCFVENLRRTSALEEENLSLKKQIDQSLNETSDRIIDLELEKDNMKKLNSTLMLQNEELKEQNNKLKADVNRLNDFVMSSFQQTLGHSREEKIKALEKKLTQKETEVLELKHELEKSKDNYEKQLKQKTLEYELLKMDYQSAIVQNIQARQTAWKDEKNKTDKGEKTEKNKLLSKNQVNKKTFNMVSAKPDNHPETISSRKTKTTLKRNTAILTVKEEIENDSDNSENYEEFGADNNQGSLDEEDEDEMYVPKKGKRKAKEAKKQQTKKIKKNENKELLLINRNTIQYHLFN